MATGHVPQSPRDVGLAGGPPGPGGTLAWTFPGFPAGLFRSRRQSLLESGHRHRGPAPSGFPASFRGPAGSCHLSPPAAAVHPAPSLSAQNEKAGPPSQSHEGNADSGSRRSNHAWGPPSRSRVPHRAAHAGGRSRASPAPPLGASSVSERAVPNRGARTEGPLSRALTFPITPEIRNLIQEADKWRETEKSHSSL